MLGGNIMNGTVKHLCSILVRGSTHLWSHIRMRATRLIRSFASGVAVAAMLVAVQAQPAGAEIATVTAWGQDATQIFARAKWVPVSGLHSWSNFRIGQGGQVWSTICRYQGAFKWQSPKGHTYDTTYSSYTSGCSLSAWKDFGNYSGRYVKGTRFPAYWKSNKTPTSDKWMHVGTLTQK